MEQHGLIGPVCPPGQLNSNGNQLLVFGKQFGNVFIGVQPTFGYEGDPMRLLFSKSASPHHGFAAFYTYLEKIFKVSPRPSRTSNTQSCLINGALGMGVSCKILHQC